MKDSMKPGLGRGRVSSCPSTVSMDSMDSMNLPDRGFLPGSEGFNGFNERAELSRNPK
jgi:hypothetical protein